MAASVELIGAVSAKDEADPLAITVGSSGVPQGGQVLVVVAADNETEATPRFTVSDDQGNTYTELAWRGRGATAKAGLTAGVYAARLDSALVENDEITYAFEGALPGGEPGPEGLVATPGAQQVTLTHQPVDAAIGYRYDLVRQIPEAVSDPLTGSGVNPATWPSVANGVTQDGTGLSIPVTAKGGNHLGSTVKGPVTTLRGHTVTVKLATPPTAGNGSRTCELAWLASDDGANRIGFVWNHTHWSVRLAVAGAHTFLQSPWGVQDGNQQWARLRHDGSALYVETSGNGTTWTTVATPELPAGFNLTDGRVCLDAEYWGTEAASTVKFTDYSYQPTAGVPVQTGWGRFADYTSPPVTVTGLVGNVGYQARVIAQTGPSAWSEWSGWVPFTPTADDGPGGGGPGGDRVDGNTGGLAWWWDANNMVSSDSAQVGEQEAVAGGVTLVTSPALAGGSSCRIECVGPRDNGVAGSGSYGKRCEGRFMAPATSLAANVGSTQVYGMLCRVTQLLLPPPGDKTFLAIVQFHGGSGSPVFALEFEPDGSLHMWRRGGDPQVNSGWAKTKILNPGQFQLNHTYALMWETRWESANNGLGYHQLWIDGVTSPAWRSEGRTRYASYNPYWKFGFYGSQRDGTCVAYYDNFCRATGPGARAAVAKKLGVTLA